MFSIGCDMNSNYHSFTGLTKKTDTLEAIEIAESTF